MMLALAAERTERIGLGPGVLVPTLRHPMVNAAATAALAALAPDRVAVAFGTGFTGPPRDGLSGDPVVVHGRATSAPIAACCAARRSSGRARGCGCCTRPATRAPRPVDVPIIVAALGPKGADVARELGDGLYITLALPEFAREFSWVSYPVLGNGPGGGRGRRLRARAGGGRTRAGRSPTTAPTSSARRWRTCPAGRSGKRSSSGRRRKSATSPSTSSTASASTRPTTPPGTRAATRCSRRRR